MFVLIFFGACKPEKETNVPDIAYKSIFTLENTSKTTLVLGDSITVILSVASDSTKIDSIQISINGQTTQTVSQLPARLAYTASSVGYQSLKATAFGGNAALEAQEFQVLVLSDTPPDTLAYTITNTFLHDATAFTEGLEFDAQGNLYEGTGLEGKSVLRRTKLATGAVEQELALKPEYFGEGITIFGDKIMQLTYQSHKGFVYNKKDFALQKEFYFANNEGWGLTHNATELIMSDGTENIYFLNPETFVQTRKMQVYDDKNKVFYLNELEWINGKIYANIYQTNFIAIIDPNSGKVISYLNLNGLLEKAQTPNQAIDVLNGIAYNPKTKKLYVTGKLWNKIFEIKPI